MKKPTLNFNAKYNYDLIDFNGDEIFEPSVTKSLLKDELMSCTECKVNIVTDFINDMPLHNQPVERAVKMVSEASSQTNGEQNRNSIIYSKVALKEIFKKNNNKTDYEDFMTIELFKNE